MQFGSIFLIYELKYLVVELTTKVIYYWLMAMEQNIETFICDSLIFWQWYNCQLYNKSIHSSIAS